MATLDRFGGPEAWDRYCAEQDERYEMAARAGCCGQCSHCDVPDQVAFPDRQDIGFCRKYDEFVPADENPWDAGCEEYAER